LKVTLDDYLWILLATYMGDYILALETSCDESAVAILQDQQGVPVIVDSMISSQIKIHREYGGVVPEVASRNHSQNLPELVREILERNSIELDAFAGFAATGGPGLASSLLIGHAMAKGFALACHKPFYSINHMEGHLLSPFIGQSSHEVAPHLSLIVSGGHTMLVRVFGLGQYEIVAKTIDDAAGEAFDKVGRMLGLPYPGGPEIEKGAKEGDTKKYDFPRSLPGKLNFSFSGLKTAVLYSLKENGYSFDKKPEGNELADYCASFQQAVIDALVKKTLLALKKFDDNLVTISGGVSCNQALLLELGGALSKRGKKFLSCERGYSTDNAAMIAYTAWFYHREGRASELVTGINPNLSLA